MWVVFVGCRQKRLRSFLKAASLPPAGRGAAPLATPDSARRAGGGQEALLHPRGQAADAPGSARLPGSEHTVSIRHLASFLPKRNSSDLKVQFIRHSQDVNIHLYDLKQLRNLLDQQVIVIATATWLPSIKVECETVIWLPSEGKFR